MIQFHKYVFIYVCICISPSQLSWWRTSLQCRRPLFSFWVGKICWRRDRLPTPIFLGFPCGSAGKESACNAGDLGSIPGLGRSPGEGKGYPLVHGVTKSWTRLSNFYFHLYMYECIYIYILFQFLPIIGYYRILNSPPCAESLLAIFSAYRSVYLLVPNHQLIPFSFPLW